MEGHRARHAPEPAARKRAPATAIDAKFSLQFTVATALLRGKVTLDSFTPAALEDPEILALASRVEFAHRPDWGRGQAVCGAVALHLPGGVQQRIGIEDPQGSPARPLGDSSLIAKFRRLPRPAAQPVRPPRRRPLRGAGSLWLQKQT